MPSKPVYGDEMVALGDAAQQLGIKSDADWEKVFPGSGGAAGMTPWLRTNILGQAALKVTPEMRHWRDKIQPHINEGRQALAAAHKQRQAAEQQLAAAPAKESSQQALARIKAMPDQSGQLTQVTAGAPVLNKGPMDDSYKAGNATVGIGQVGIEDPNKMTLPQQVMTVPKDKGESKEAWAKRVKTEDKAVEKSAVQADDMLAGASLAKELITHGATLAARAAAPAVEEAAPRALKGVEAMREFARQSPPRGTKIPETVGELKRASSWEGKTIGGKVEMTPPEGVSPADATLNEASNASKIGKDRMREMAKDKN